MACLRHSWCRRQAVDAGRATTRAYLREPAVVGFTVPAVAILLLALVIVGSGAMAGAMIIAVMLTLSAVGIT